MKINLTEFEAIILIDALNIMDGESGWLGDALKASKRVRAKIYEIFPQVKKL